MQRTLGRTAGVRAKAPPSSDGGAFAVLISAAGAAAPARCRASRSAAVATCSRPKPNSTLSRVTVADDQSITACERTNSLALPGLPAGAPAIVHGPEAGLEALGVDLPAGGRDLGVVDEQPGAAGERVAHVGDRHLHLLAGVGRQVEGDLAPAAGRSR